MKIITIYGFSSEINLYEIYPPIYTAININIIPILKKILQISINRIFFAIDLKLIPILVLTNKFYYIT